MAILINFEWPVSDVTQASFYAGLEHEKNHNSYFRKLILTENFRFEILRDSTFFFPFKITVWIDMDIKI